MTKTARKDSGFVTIHDGQRILVVKRCDSKKSFYLPGGGLSNTIVGGEAGRLVRQLCSRQLGFHLDHDDLPIWNSRSFRLSKDVGGGYVTLFEHQEDALGLDKWKARYRGNEHTGSVHLFGIDELWDHLHQTERMPWGQVHMALWALSGKDNQGFRAIPLRDDFGFYSGLNWCRP